MSTFDPTASLPEVQHILELNCFVLGDSPNHTFPVKIARTESVGTLKEAIKEKMKPAFDHIRANSLVLWNVDIPFDRTTLQDSIRELDLTDEGSLSPVERLLNIFVDLPDYFNVHIVVRRTREFEPFISPPTTGHWQVKAQEGELAQNILDVCCCPYLNSKLISHLFPPVSCTGVKAGTAGEHSCWVCGQGPGHSL
jgi:hypothetical protein